LIHGDFFALDWHALLAELPDPLLVIGNPPWVTNSALAAIDSQNMPRKHNAHGHRGNEAIKGKSNFDISEWMRSRVADLLHGRVATLAVLCKTTVARKVLVHVWKRACDVADSSLYRIDALKHFGASVDACLLVLPFAPGSRSTRCAHHASLTERTPRATFGRHDHQLIADIAAYERWKHLCGDDPVYIWRSGIKHDCSRVMELRREGHAFRNGLGERVELEPDHVYPCPLDTSPSPRDRLIYPVFRLLPEKKKSTPLTVY